MMKRQEILNRALNSLEDKDGNLDAHKVLAAAKNARHPLHIGWGFDWDDKSAARKYNLDVARNLIRLRVRVETSVEIVRCPAYVRNPSREADEPGYRAVSKLRTDRELARESLEAELSRVLSALQRAHAVAVALELAQEFDELLYKVTQLQRTVERKLAA
jgi:hypothetical protein